MQRATQDSAEKIVFLHHPLLVREDIKTNPLIYFDIIQSYFQLDLTSVYCYCCAAAYVLILAGLGRSLNIRQLVLWGKQRMASAPNRDHSHGNRSGQRAWYTELRDIELISLFEILLLHCVSKSLMQGLFIFHVLYHVSLQSVKEYMIILLYIKCQNSQI